jgi:pilus assembly protein CpaD
MTITITPLSALKGHRKMEKSIRARHPVMASTAAALLVSLLLSSCGNSQMTTGSISDDYRTRHPIVLAEGAYTLDVPVASGDVRLTIGQKDMVRGFAQNFSASAAGVVQIQVPHGSYNAGAATKIAGDIRRTLTENGIRAQRIMMTNYAASPNGDAAPIRLQYVATKAMTSACGEWPEDLSNDTMTNRNWYNFGCASQNNLAAQIANPSDLIAPRGMTPIDATQRAKVISDYRGETSSSGTTTTTTTTTN